MLRQLLEETELGLSSWLVYERPYCELNGRKEIFVDLVVLLEFRDVALDFLLLIANSLLMW